MEMRSKLRAMFIKHIYPIAIHEFGWLFDPITHWMKGSNVKLYARFVSGVTAGKLFWPRSHTDPDLWYTVLVCLDYGRGVMSGADFGFASVGLALECQHCDVIIYNPTHHHGTTEFELYPKDEESGRIFFAFFMKKQVLHADILSQAMVKRIGVQKLNLRR
jgi:hypothetical protein